MELTIEALIREAKEFSEFISTRNHPGLIGVTDGKKIGTYMEYHLEKFLRQKGYTMTGGNAALGLDLPSVNTDIKATSINKPQSSSPFRSARQKIYGLGYNLLVFVYDKRDTQNTCSLLIKHCAFIKADRTADFTTTALIRKILSVGANKDDIVALLNDRYIPGDEITHENLAEEILRNPPEQGYLTISNAFQWRLKYTRAVELNNSVEGVINFVW